MRGEGVFTLLQTMLENCRCKDVKQKLNTSTKAAYVTKLSDALIMQLNIFKCIGGIIKVSTSLSIGKKILYWG